jgi:hypothetical protein
MQNFTKMDQVQHPVIEKFKKIKILIICTHSGQNTKWNCTFSGYYRGQTANIASYSEDGSLLCVGFGPVLTIWDPDTNVLLQTLANHKDKSDMK